MNNKGVSNYSSQYLKPESPKDLIKNSELEEARIKKIDVLSLGTTLALINIIFGFIFGLFFTLFSLFGVGFLQQIPGLSISGLFNWIIGIGAVIFFPILFGIFGFFQGIFGALLYNLASKISKGIKLYGI